MRTVRPLVERASRFDVWLSARARVAARVAFGDRVGLAIFLLALAFFGLYWRIGIFVNDNYTIANALVGVADGHLHVDGIVFGPDPEYQPGMHVVGERLYGRNYGHVFLALPFLWALEATALLAEPRIVLAGAWSLVVISLAVTVGRLVGRRAAFSVLGSAAGFALFAANVSLATPLDPLWLPVAALQLATMVSAAFVGVVLYRLLALLHDRRIGLFAGIAVVLATPIGFWASVPKRHALTALLAVIALYGFARSRHADGDVDALRFRATAYVAVGLTAWVHAAEALILFAVLVPLDLLTARSNDPRRLAGVGLAFAVSLLPFLLTNALIAGNPLKPPRLLPNYRGQLDVLLEGSSSGVDGSPIATELGSVEPADATPTRDAPSADEPVSGPSADDDPFQYGARGDSSGISVGDPTGSRLAAFGGDSSTGPTPSGASDTASRWDPDGFAVASTAIRGLFGSISDISSSVETAVDYFVSTMVRGVTILSEQPERLYRTFVRSGWIDAQAPDREAVNLTVLESTPLLGALAALPLLAVQYVRHRWRTASLGPAAVVPSTPRGQTDAFVLLYTLAFVVFYMPRLPLHVQVTVRYLLPIVPMLCYAVARVTPIRRIVHEAGTELAWGYAGFVLVGGQLGAVAVAALAPSTGEALQLFALVGLFVAGLTGIWVLVDPLVDGLDARIGAGIVALTGAVSTAFLLLSGLAYLRYGDFALGISRFASELLSAL